MAGAIVALGLIQYAIHGFSHFPLYFFVVAGIFAFLGLVAPITLKPVLIIWLKLATVLNWVMTHVLLTIVYWLVIAPMGIVMRIFSEDPLKRKWLPKDQSYWESPEEQPAELEHWRNQF